MRNFLLRIFAATCLLMPLAGHPEIARHLDEELEHGRRVVEASPQGEGATDQIRSLKEAIARGETASRQLREEIQRLEKIQAVLTSGLIGAVVTAIVAMLSAFANFRRSRADRDYRRLEVIEKAQQLKSAGIRVPADILRNYEDQSGSQT
ncbi:hypothetical protein [Methylomicrobium album]|jgi:hypothetical protein|uniref:Uncharacterized protein n=1 Tax=Methylomicrobium album BG8 TaxID=686340 RepID=H8GRJ7_METAL|nr:hypothetical protein [Methylomicrobium album]EIC27839.1 hypothetical protein Metal_4008 [Methylomicrobium album BG8]